MIGISVRTLKDKAKNIGLKNQKGRICIYTKKDWKADRNFNAFPGQEVSEEIYDEMLNSIPSKDIPRETLNRTTPPCRGGFLMGEPQCDGCEGSQYLAFGYRVSELGRKYFYLGLSHKGLRVSGPNTFYAVTPHDRASAELDSVGEGIEWAQGLGKSKYELYVVDDYGDLTLVKRV